jgi:hypothetical protein
MIENVGRLNRNEIGEVIEKIWIVDFNGRISFIDLKEI